MAPSAPTLPSLTGAVPWTHLDRLPDRPAEFTFAFISDRTGGARPGVFEKAIEVTNAMRPDFAIQPARFSDVQVTSTTSRWSR